MSLGPRHHDDTTCPHLMEAALLTTQLLAAEEERDKALAEVAKLRHLIDPNVLRLAGMPAEAKPEPNQAASAEDVHKYIPSPSHPTFCGSCGQHRDHCPGWGRKE